MRVLTMAFMDCAYYLLGVASLALSLFAGFFFPLGYVAAIMLAIMFILLFLSIPLKLNWSSNLYGHLFRRFLLYLMFLLLVYAICYYRIGYERLDGTRASLFESIYISITTFTTLQYGEFKPLPACRPLACAESLMGILGFSPFFAAFGWLYCQNRLWPQSIEEQSTPNDLRLVHDQATGGWAEVETEKTKAEAEERNRRIALIPCKRCGSKAARIDKIYDITGRTTPLALFVAHCSCGEITKPSTTALLAAWRWKRFKIRSKPFQPQAPDASATSESPTGESAISERLVIARKKPDHMGKD